MKRRFGRLMLYVTVVFGAVVFTIPLLWMLSTAVKPIDQVMSSPPKWLPYEYLVDIDGQAFSVGMDMAPEGVTADTPVKVGVAYQWLLEIDGEPVPVKPLAEYVDTQSGAEIDLAVYYHTRVRGDGGLRPVRLSESIDAPGDDGLIDVVAMEDDGYMSRMAVEPAGLIKTYDKTVKDLSTSFSEFESLTVPVESLRNTLVPWGDRKALAHVLVERREVRYGDITEKVSFRWRNFREAIEAMGMFPTYLKNTLILCVLTVIGTVISSTLVAYGFSRIEWPGRDKVFLLVMATMMIPGSVMMVPLFTLFRDLGWIGTLKPLWVPTFFAGAFNVFLLRQFFRTIPKDLSEAAKIDGCSELRIFWQIILPLAKPAITVVALFQFMGTWNDFLGPLIYLTEQEDFTLALGLQFFQSKSGGTQWHYLMAASSLVVLPVVVLFFLAQRAFIEGISMSGLKG